MPSLSTTLFSNLLGLLLSFHVAYLTTYLARDAAHGLASAAPSRQLLPALRMEQRPRPTGAPPLPADTSAPAAPLPPPAAKRVIAMYFPQFHEFETNNRLWGAGYTDFAGVRPSRTARYGYPVQRPLDGYYDLRHVTARRAHGRLASAYGIHGFAYYHYWFQGGPVMEAPLEALLQDGEPALPFMLAWANEDWTRRWDGGSNGGDAMLMKQTYAEEDWAPHFAWLLRFFLHPLYIRRGGGDERPMLLLYRIHDIPALEAMLGAWQGLARAAGLPGLYIVQMNGHEWHPGALQPSALAAGVMEFYPNFYNVPMGGSIRPQAWQEGTNGGAASSGDYFFGAHAGFNNKPRHATDGAERVLPYHPTALKFSLRAALARTPPGSLVFVNAWNEWGEGCVLEPSVEFGYGWLRAVKGAVEEEAAGAPLIALPRAAAAAGAEPPPPPPPPPPPLPLQPPSTAPPPTVCILVRTYKAHADGGHFTLRRLLQSLQAQDYPHWRAHVVDNSLDFFEGAAGIVASLGDARITAVPPLPEAQRSAYDAASSSYPFVDRALAQHCSADTPAGSTGSSGAVPEWFLVTNGDNLYAPDALSFLLRQEAQGADLVLMNFYSRYTLANSLALTGADSAGCCSRLASYTCTASAPVIGLVDLGAMVFRRASWAAARAPPPPAQPLSFSQFTGACPTSCHDGALAQHVARELQWSIVSHPITQCALLHNPNPVACRLVGGIYYDSPRWEEAGCYDVASLPMPLEEVDWAKFAAGDGCVCREE